MAEHDRGLPVVDLALVLSPEAFSKLRAARQRREQAKREEAALNESSRNESRETDSEDGGLKETGREEESGLAEHDAMDTAATAETSAQSFKVSDKMQMSEETTHSDEDQKLVAKMCTSMSLGPIKKRKRPETQAEPQCFLMTLGAIDSIRNGLDFAMTRLFEHMAYNKTIPCSLVSAYRSIPLSRYRRTCSRYVHYYDTVI